jgi:hypothetical protein
VQAAAHFVATPASLPRLHRLDRWAGEEFQAKIKNLNRWASYLIFKSISRILSLKSKVSNISN